MSAAQQLPVVSGQLPVDARPSGLFQQQLAEMLGEVMAAANLVGRLHALQVVKKKTGRTLKLNTLVSFADGQSVSRSVGQSAGSAKPKDRKTDRPKDFTFDDTNILGFESVPFQGAIDRVRNLMGVSRLAFDGMASRYKMQAFTIAGTQDVRLIEALKSALADVMQQGGTLADFRKAADALTADAGAAAFGRTHLETVFQTNVQTAYQNGKFEQMRDPDVLAALPYWQYCTAGDARVRPAHAALDGFTAAATDPVWGRLYPPTGYNCRCTVIPILGSEAPAGADEPGLRRLPMGAASVPDPGFGGMAR